jgi:very-short-patch-repair endonuclease
MPSTDLVRKLRRDQTPAERRFWVILQPFRELGHHFRRQAPIGTYVVDFVCKQQGLVFEIDGDSHYQNGAVRRDQTRADYLATRGYRVVRFTNLEVMGNPEGVYAVVARALGEADTPS